MKLLFDECRDAGSTLVFVSHDTSLEGMFDRTVNLTDINRPADSAAGRGA